MPKFMDVHEGMVGVTPEALKAAQVFPVPVEA
jgi:hypothetical protein